MQDEFTEQAGAQPASVIWGDEGVSQWPRRAWLRMLFRPRPTIRGIVDSDPLRYFFVLAMLYGISTALNRFIGRSAAEVTSLTSVLFFLALGGAVGGVINLFLNGAIFTVLARLLGSSSTSEDIRAALAWSNIPVILLLVLWPLLLLSYGGDVFTAEASGVVAGNPLPLVIFSILLTLASVWGMVLFWYSYAEVNGFSLRRALLGGVLPYFAVTLLISFGLGAINPF